MERLSTSLLARNQKSSRRKPWPGRARLRAGDGIDPILAQHEGMERSPETDLQSLHRPTSSPPPHKRRRPAARCARDRPRNSAGAHRARTWPRWPPGMQMARHFARRRIGFRFVAEDQAPFPPAFQDRAAQPRGRMRIVIAGDPKKMRPRPQSLQHGALLLTQPLGGKGIVKQNRPSRNDAGRGASGWPSPPPSAAAWRGCHRAAGTDHPGHRNCLFRNADRQISGCGCAPTRRHPICPASVARHLFPHKDQSTRIASAISASS